MPKPKKNEKKSKFIDRCVPQVKRDGTAKDNQQAVAICNSIWDNHKKRSNSMENKQVTVLQDQESETKPAQINGTIYRKQVARFGTWINPLYPFLSEELEMTLDMEWAESIIENFNKGIPDRVPVPLDHTDSTSANTGEVMKLEAVEGDGLYAYIDVRRDQVAQDIEKGLIFDVSISFVWDYVDQKDGKHHGPTLLHVALVNNPYLSRMEGFETVQEFINGLADSLGLAKPDSKNAIMLSKSKVKELKQMEEVTITNDKDFDVQIEVNDEDGNKKSTTLQPGDETQVPQDQSEDVLKQIADAENPEEEEDEEEGKSKDDDKEKETGKEKDKEKEPAPAASNPSEGVELSNKDIELNRYRLKDKYETLLSNGKITPAQKDKFMELANATGEVKLAGKQTDLASVVSDILEAGPKVLDFAEEGSSKEDSEQDDNKDKKPSERLSDEDKAGLKAVGVTPERMDELAEKYPEMNEILNEENK